MSTSGAYVDYKLSVATAGTEIGCSLGLDASLIDASAGDDATPPAEGGADAPAHEVRDRYFAAFVHLARAKLGAAPGHRR